MAPWLQSRTLDALLSERLSPQRGAPPPARCALGTSIRLIDADTSPARGAEELRERFMLQAWDFVARGPDLAGETLFQTGGRLARTIGQQRHFRATVHFTIIAILSFRLLIRVLPLRNQQKSVSRIETGC